VRRDRGVCLLFRRTERGCGLVARLVSFEIVQVKTTVALSGEGADELFGGYITCRADMLAKWARRMPRPFLQAALVGVAIGPFRMRKSASNTS